MSGKSVMVVDDSSTIRKILKRELSRGDYEVIPAQNGLEALAILEWADVPPDLITIDIDMPGMNGFELCEKIRRLADSKDGQKIAISQLPIIFVSSNDTIENRERAYDLEVIDFISKPFTSGKMLQTINNILLNAQEQFSDMTALIVEDSPVVSRIIRNILVRHGLETFEVSNGEKALEIIKEEQFAIDIIITDYIMPKMSGKELCRKLRHIEAFENVPIFFISSIDSKDTILDFFKVGANDYLPKPFLEEEFRARVLTHLRNRKYVKELELLNNQLKFQAEHDALTGLYNRGYFQKKITNIFPQKRDNNRHLSCVILDLDFFKKVNDNYGHAFGDLVLQEFSKTLSSSCRSTDLAARYGGEEFVVLMPDTNISECHSVAEQLRKAAEDSVYSDGKTELRATVSIGAASLQDHEPMSPDQLLNMADEALYVAKENGRNRVEAYSK